MNWDDIRIFLTVARNPKLERASVLLHQDATTISRRIRRLENGLGETLFERTRRGHTLTMAGERLAEKAEMMESMTLTISSGNSDTHSIKGRVRLGTPEGLGTSVIAPALAAFSMTHPELMVDLIALSGFVSVPKRHADMSILLTRPTEGRLKVRRLSDYKLGLYGAINYLSQRSEISAISDLLEHDLIGYTEDLIYSSQLKYLQDLLPHLTPKLCSPSINAQMELVIAGAGIGILPQFMANRNPNLIPILPNEIDISRTFWLATHEELAELPRIKVTKDFLINLRI